MTITCLNIQLKLAYNATNYVCYEPQTQKHKSLLKYVKGEEIVPEW